MQTAIPIWLQTTLHIAVFLTVIIFTVSMIVIINNRSRRMLQAQNDASRIVEFIGSVHLHFQNRFMPATVRRALDEAHKNYLDIRSAARLIFNSAGVSASIREVDGAIRRIRDAQDAALANFNPQKERDILNQEEAQSSEICESEKGDIEAQFAKDLAVLTEARNRKVKVVQEQHNSNLGRINRLREQLETQI